MPTTEGVTKRMKRNLRRDTAPELAVRAELYRRGRRYRVHHPLRLEGRIVRPDVVFVGKRVAVFVDGCFWHCCPIHGNEPAANTGYWQPKLARNVRRDEVVNRDLLAAGWTVVRAWEHEDPVEVADRVEAALKQCT